MIERIYNPLKKELTILLDGKFIFGAHGSVAQQIYEKFIKKGESVTIGA